MRFKLTAAILTLATAVSAQLTFTPIGPILSGPVRTSPFARELLTNDYYGMRYLLNIWNSNMTAVAMYATNAGTAVVSGYSTNAGTAQYLSGQVTNLTGLQPALGFTPLPPWDTTGAVQTVIGQSNNYNGTFSGVASNLTGISAIATNVQASQIIGSGYDSNAVNYANAVGLATVERGYVNEMVKAVKAAVGGVSWDAYLCPSNYNATSPLTLFLHSVTNVGTPVVDGAGMHTDGSTSAAIVPMPAGTNFTVVLIYCGNTNNAANQNALVNPWGLCNSGGPASGFFCPTNNGWGQMRMSLGIGGASEITAISQTPPCGWFLLPGANDWLDPWDYRWHFVAITWNNGTGTISEGVDNDYTQWAQGVTFSTRFTNNALNVLTLGGTLGASGMANLFAGTYYAALVFNTNLTTAQLTAVQSALRWVQPGTKEHWVIGDSKSYQAMALGVGVAGYTNYQQSWPVLLAGGPANCGATLGQPPNNDTLHIMHGMSGWTAYTYDTGGWVDTLFGPYGRKGKVTDVLADVRIGVNDWGQQASTNDAQIYANISNIVARCQFYGAKVRLWTFSAVAATEPYQAAFYTNQVTGTRVAARILANPAIAQAGFVRPDLWTTSANMDSNAVPQLSYDGLHEAPAGSWLLYTNVVSLLPISDYVGRFNGNAAFLTNLPILFSRTADYGNATFGHPFDNYRYFYYAQTSNGTYSDYVDWAVPTIGTTTVTLTASLLVTNSGTVRPRFTAARYAGGSEPDNLLYDFPSPVSVVADLNTVSHTFQLTGTTGVLVVGVWLNGAAAVSQTTGLWALTVQFQ